MRRTVILTAAVMMVSASAASAQVRIRVPFVRVDVNGGVHVRAPFVNLYVPGGPPVYVVPPPAFAPPPAFVPPAPLPAPLPRELPEAPPPAVKPAQPKDDPEAPPPAARTDSLTLADFAKSFKPKAGNYEVEIVNPVTNQPTSVRFSLPEGTPRRVHVSAREIEFDYGARRYVKIQFDSDGAVVISR